MLEFTLGVVSGLLIGVVVNLILYKLLKDDK